MKKRENEVSRFFVSIENRKDCVENVLEGIIV